MEKQEIEEVITNSILANVKAHVSEVVPEDRLMSDLGMDSLDVISVEMEVISYFDLPDFVLYRSDRDLEHELTVKDVFDLAESKIKAKEKAKAKAVKKS